MSLNKTDQELRELGINAYCPTRRSNRGRRPNITGCGTEENDEERHRPWVFPDISQMSHLSKKKLLTEALHVILIQILKTHAYEFAGAILLKEWEQ